MRAVIQRCSSGSVTVDGELIGQVGRGLVVLLGVAGGDTQADLDYLVDKIVGLRIFEDAAGKMNLSLQEVQGEMLVVSQFTLLADTRKGRRPSFLEAAQPEIAEQFYQQFVALVRALGITVATGKFRAEMQVALVNEGPVTIVLDSRQRGGG
jgi:D-tyrosyl-tRNA(Tyr) deacylase